MRREVIHETRIHHSNARKPTPNLLVKRYAPPVSATSGGSIYANQWV